MTKDASPGPSLSQARRRLSNVDQTPDVRPRLSQQDNTSNQLRDALSHEHVRPRQLSDLESAVAQVVQTVSVAVVQVVDSTGAVVDVQTVLPGQAITTPAAPALDLTVDATLLKSLVPTVPVLDSLIPTVLPSPATPDVPSTQTTSTEPKSTSDPGSVTTTPPLTSSAPFPTSLGAFNSTRSALFSNGTTLRTFFANTSTLSTSSSTDIFANLFSTDVSSSDTLTDAPSATDVGSDNSGQDGPVPTLTEPPTVVSTSAATPTPAGLTPTQTYVVSGLVGGIAGIAIVALALMFIIKWKRRQGQGLRLLGDGDGTSGMGERSTNLMAIPATLMARNATHRNKQPARMIEAGAHPEDQQTSTERSFYRVSGRKLTSVLQSGGDGYSEPTSPSRPPRSPLVSQQPRDSANPFTDPPYQLHNSIDPFSDDDGGSSRVVSGSSFYNYRDSMAAFSGPHSPQLQLGSPMRPESGIMMMRSGPARTPVHEQAPVSYFHEHDDVPATPSMRNSYGRNLTAQARQSQDSPSRFSENL